VSKVPRRKSHVEKSRLKRKVPRRFNVFQRWIDDVSTLNQRNNKKISLVVCGSIWNLREIDVYSREKIHLTSCGIIFDVGPTYRCDVEKYLSTWCPFLNLESTHILRRIFYGDLVDVDMPYIRCIFHVAVSIREVFQTRISSHQEFSEPEVFRKRRFPNQKFLDTEIFRRAMFPNQSFPNRKFSNVKGL